MKNVLDHHGVKNVLDIMNSMKSLMASVRTNSAEEKRNQQIVKGYEQFSVIGELYGLAVKSEALRRMSSFVSIRNGIEGNAEYDMYRENFEMALGMSLDQFFTSYQNGDLSIDDKVKFAKTRDGKYWASRDQAEINMLTSIMEDVYKAMDIAVLLNTPQMSFFKQSLEYYYNLYKDFDISAGEVFIRNHDIFKKDLFQRVKADLLIGRMNQSQRIEFDNTITDVLIDGYYKHNNRHHNIAIQSIIDGTDGVRRLGTDRWDFMDGIS